MRTAPPTHHTIGETLAGVSRIVGVRASPSLLASRRARCWIAGPAGCAAMRSRRSKRRMRSVVATSTNALPRNHTAASHHITLAQSMVAAMLSSVGSPATASTAKLVSFAAPSATGVAIGIATTFSASAARGSTGTPMSGGVSSLASTRIHSTWASAGLRRTR